MIQCSDEIAFERVANPFRLVASGKKKASRMRLMKCPVCDTVVEVLEDCGIELVCCGPAMIPLSERTATDTSHRLTVQKTGRSLTVTVGPDHEMEDGHHIAWIEIATARSTSRKFLTPGDDPIATFAAPAEPAVIRAYCSAHGLWRQTADADGADARPSTRGVYRAAV